MLRTPLLYVLVLCAAPAALLAENIVKFAQVSAFESGPAEASIAVQTGIRAAFAEVNAAGGVKGHTLVLDSFDDGYEPDRTLVEVKKIIDADKHIALIGNYGGGTGAVSAELTAKAHWPFIGPVSGAQFLRAPQMSHVFNLRESYASEMAVATGYLVDDLKIEKIGVLYQDDAFGLSGLEGVRAALAERGLEPTAEAAYIRNTTAVKVGLYDIRRQGSEAVIIIGVADAAQTFIETAASIDYHPRYAASSIMESAKLAADLGAQTKGMIVTQVVPMPTGGGKPIVAEYQAALAAHTPEAMPDFMSMEGYLIGRLAIEALKGAETPFTHQSLLDSLQSLEEFEIGGVKFAYGPEDNQGLGVVFVTEMDGAGGFWRLFSTHGNAG